MVTVNAAIAPVQAAPGASESVRHDRPAMIAFVNDNDTETALREGLAETAGASLDVRRGGIRGAIAAMRKGTTPRVVIIVTPYIVGSATDPDALHGSGDGYVAPNDIERVLLLRQLGGGKPGSGSRTASASVPGDAGFIVR